VQFFDLTQPLYAGMPVLRGDPAVSIVPIRTHEADGYEVTEICLGSHSGTHLDAPRHFLRDGRTLDTYPPERFVGPAVVVDCSAGPGRAVIEARHLTQALGPHQVPVNGFVLIRTGGNLLATDAARLLLEKGAGIVGVDSPSPDAEPYPVHRLLLANDILILENLSGLDRMKPGPATCACLPLAVEGTDAAPARVIAWR
jgi:arylformamidase